VEPVLITGKGKPPKTAAKATIARTNLGLLLRAITFITEHKDVKHLYFEGNLNSYTYADEGASLYDVLNLYNNKRERIRDKLIGSMASLADLEEYIEKTEDVQLSMMVEIVNEYGNEIPALLQALKSKHVGDEEKEKAEMIFSTVHRAKGMEYDAVQLVEDFVSEARLEKVKVEKKEGEELNIAKWNEEINLLYVAVTRTKGLLRIPETLLPKNFPQSANIHVIKAQKEEGVNEVAGRVTKPVSRQKADQKKNKQKEQTSSFTERRLQHKNSYERWTPELDAELKALYYKGTVFTKIVAHFGRKEGAILARLKKLGCVHYEE
jgi:superfamily I DNA/RNA helicase